MTQLSNNRTPRRGRIFPEYTIPPEELARRKAERDARGQRCRAVLEQVRPQLIADHYNWFIIIEPNSSDYFIDPDSEVAVKKAREKYPSGWLVAFRLNETGTCGKNMISGRFGDNGELFFEIDLIAGDGDRLSVEALLDTGFTTGWLAMDTQDAESLGWELVQVNWSMQTARGEEFFNIYAGTVLFGGEEFTIPVHVGQEVPEILLGLQWLKTMRLVVDFPAGVLTLG